MNSTTSSTSNLYRRHHRYHHTNSAHRTSSENFPNPVPSPPADHDDGSVTTHGKHSMSSPVTVPERGGFTAGLVRKSSAAIPASGPLSSLPSSQPGLPWASHVEEHYGDSSSSSSSSASSSDDDEEEEELPGAPVGVPFRQPLSAPPSRIGSLPCDVKETAVLIKTRSSPPSKHRNSKQLKLINQYLLMREIGRGCHGKVKLAKDLETGQEVAIKMIEKTDRQRRLNALQRQGPEDCAIQHLWKLRHEIALMKKMRHPNVVRLVEVIDDPKADKVYMVLENMEGGEVHWRTRDKKPALSESQTRSIFRDVVVGLEYLHFQGIIHRDIKPANLLVSRDGVAKITDFGVSYFSRRQRSGRGHSSHLSNKGTRKPAKSGGRGVVTREQRCPQPSQTGSKKWAYRSHSYSPGIVAESSSGAFVPDGELLQEYQQALEARKLKVLRSAPLGDLNAPPACLGRSGRSLAVTLSHPSLYELRDDPVSELIKTKGSPAFFAPELCVADATPRISKAIDVWALGITLYCLVYGKCPFMADTEFELLDIIPREPVVFPSHVEASRSVRDLISRLLEKDPGKRISLAKAKRHPWTVCGMENPEKWLKDTDPEHYDVIAVDQEDKFEAVTILQRIMKQVRKAKAVLSPKWESSWSLGKSEGKRRSDHAMPPD